MATEPPKKARRQLSGFRPARQPDNELGIDDSQAVKVQIATGGVEVERVDVEGAELLDGSEHGRFLDGLQSFQRKGPAEDKVKPLPQLSSAEDLLSDQSVQPVLTLTTCAMTWKWLRRLPCALRFQRDLNDAVRAAALEACRDNIPFLLADENKAVAWLAKISEILCWHEVDGPARGPVEPATGPHEDCREVQEWDEAYRSLWVLLLQGVISTFCIESDRFSVVVFGDGTEPWTSPTSGEVIKPSRLEPCAVLWPSTRELRCMLQGNHVYFDMPPRSLQRQASLEQPQSLASESVKGVTVMPYAKGGTEVEDHLSAKARQDLLELRRDGERAKTPGGGEDFKLTKSALCFQGSWRVHMLMNVLRQHFLGHPMPSAVKMPRAELSIQT